MIETEDDTLIDWGSMKTPRGVFFPKTGITTVWGFHGEREFYDFREMRLSKDYFKCKIKNPITVSTINQTHPTSRAFRPIIFTFVLRGWWGI